MLTYYKHRPAPSMHIKRLGRHLCYEEARKLQTRLSTRTRVIVQRADHNSAINSRSENSDQQLSDQQLSDQQLSDQQLSDLTQQLGDQQLSDQQLSDRQLSDLTSHFTITAQGSEDSFGIIKGNC